MSGLFVVCRFYEKRRGKTDLCRFTSSFKWGYGIVNLNISLEF